MRNYYFLFILTFAFLVQIPKAIGQSCNIVFNDITTTHRSQLKSLDYKQTLDSLNQIGYYTVKIDSTLSNPCTLYITKGKQYKKIYISSKNELINSRLKYDIQNQQYYTHNLDSIIAATKLELLNQGKPFAKISLNPEGYLNQNALVHVNITETSARKIDDIKFIGYNKIPKFLKGQLLKETPIYNDSILNDIQNKIESYSFLKQTQDSRVSFSQDSTILYIYVEKVRQNSFDGLIGFETDEENKLNLQGNVNIQLNNAFNRNESLFINWESSADKSQNLNFGTRIPYLFQSNFGIHTRLNLVKQDSSFVKFGIQNEIEYYLSTNHFIGGHYNYMTSNYISSSSNEKDFTKNGWGLSYNYQRGTLQRLQENKLQITFSSSLWQKKLDSEEDEMSQTELRFDINYQHRIWKNHFAMLRVYGGNLIYDADKDKNDMYMVGGFNSMRGYNQNSIFTSSYNFSTIAYRFIPNDKILFEIFTDLGFLEIENSDDFEFLQAYGIGMNFKTNFGLFQLSYALPSEVDNSGIKNGKVHIGVKSYF